MKRNNIGDLRTHLFESLELLKSGKLEIEKAKAIADIGRVIIESARAELEFLKLKGGDGTGFIENTSTIEDVKHEEIIEKK